MILAVVLNLLSSPHKAFFVTWRDISVRARAAPRNSSNPPRYNTGFRFMFSGHHLFSLWSLSSVYAYKMSSTPTTPDKNSLKRPAPNSIIGYVHNLSCEKWNQKTMNYVSFTMQTSQNRSKEALIYSKHKQQLFTESQSNRTPIKLND